VERLTRCSNKCCYRILIRSYQPHRGELQPTDRTCKRLEERLPGETNLVGVELCGVLERLHSMGLAQSNNNAKLNYSAKHKQIVADHKCGEKIWRAREGEGKKAALRCPTDLRCLLFSTSFFCHGLFLHRVAAKEGAGAWYPEPIGSFLLRCFSLRFSFPFLIVFPSFLLHSFFYYRPNRHTCGYDLAGCTSRDSQRGVTALSIFFLVCWGSFLCFCAQKKEGGGGGHAHRRPRGQREVSLRGVGLLRQQGIDG
jgi:hypothetical protein